VPGVILYVVILPQRLSGVQ